MELSSNLTPAQVVIVRTFQRTMAEPGDWCYKEGEDTLRYLPEQYVTAARCGVPVESVEEALVAAGMRPPLSWIG